MVAEFRGERSKAIDVHGDARAFHLGQHALERELHIGEQAPGAAGLNLGVEHRGQFADRRGLGSEIVVAAVQGELTVAAGGDGSTQVALAQACEVSCALAGLHQVRRQRRIRDNALQVHPE